MTSDKRLVTSDKKAPKTNKVPLFFVLCLWSLVAGLWSDRAFSADKNWTAQGDQQNWFDGSNWLPSGVPAEQDAVKVDKKDSSVDLGQSFDVRALTVGGKKSATVNVSNFVSGSIEPSSPDEEALLLRKEGKLVLKGSSGILTIKGTYKDSEEAISEEPGFMLHVQ